MAIIVLCGDSRRVAIVLFKAQCCFAFTNTPLGAVSFLGGSLDISEYLQFICHFSLIMLFKFW